MPYAEKITDDLAEGNHTFCVLYEGGYGNTLDILARPDIAEQLQSKFGAEPEVGNPLSGPAQKQHGESVVLGLSLLQKGTIVGGFVKQTHSTIDDTAKWWNASAQEVDSQYLLESADRSELLWAAQSVLRAHQRSMLDIEKWVKMSMDEQIAYLSKLVPVKNMKSMGAYRRYG